MFTARGFFDIMSDNEKLEQPCIGIPHGSPSHYLRLRTWTTVYLRYNTVSPSLPLSSPASLCPCDFRRMFHFCCSGINPSVLGGTFTIGPISPPPFPFAASSCTFPCPTLSFRLGPQGFLAIPRAVDPTLAAGPPPPPRTTAQKDRLSPFFRLHRLIPNLNLVFQSYMDHPPPSPTAPAARAHAAARYPMVSPFKLWFAPKHWSSGRPPVSFPARSRKHRHPSPTTQPNCDPLTKSRRLNPSNDEIHNNDGSSRTGSVSIGGFSFISLSMCSKEHVSSSSIISHHPGHGCHTLSAQSLRAFFV